MNVVDYSLKYVKRKIPIEVLTHAMNVTESAYSIYKSSLDSKIYKHIIREKVMLDTRLLGGIEMLVPLQGIEPQFDQYNNVIYDIPLERTMGREIIATRGVASVPLGGERGFSGGIGVSGSYQLGQRDICDPPTAMDGALGKVYGSHKGALTDYNANSTLIGPNVVLIYGMRQYLSVGMALKVLVEQDGEMNHLQPASFIHFANLVTMATKEHIYNTLIIKMGAAALQGGQELGVFSSIVESYSDEGEKYDEFLMDQWRRVEFFNDQARSYKHLKRLTHPGY